MTVRYIVDKPFSAYVDGVWLTFTPNYTHRDGQPGYPNIPTKLNKAQKDLFRAIDVDTSGAGPVEQATAAPGEKRTIKPKTAATKAKAGS